MKFLLLNQTFHPDVVATSQYLTELARSLPVRGHQISVICGRHAYDNPDRTFPARETWNGIDIRRVRGTCFGKASKLRRAADFASFIAACCWQLLFAPRPDVIVALTSLPLISFIGACFAMVRRCRFGYWVMDLNPDEAVAAGWLRERSFITRVLQRMSHFSFHRADAVVVLDRFMHDRVFAKGVAKEKIHIIAPWPHDDIVRFDPAGREQFRAQHGLAGKFVIMYSGNHSPCHPLDTLLAGAKALAAESAFAFCFVGGGSEFAKVKQCAADNRLANITCLPYQPLDELSASLSAADVVVMGNPFVGTIHPCKTYNILTIGAPLLDIGPRPSHVTDLFDQSCVSSLCKAAEHGMFRL
jgi:colanic acid biosynthesis glycosyl transferase WcaI